MYFQFEKIQPYLIGFREKMNLPEFLRSIETVVVGAQERRTRAVTKTKTKRIPKARAQGTDVDESATAALES
jgi:hypothetical protein